MARTSHRPSGVSPARLLLRGLALALGTLGLVLLGQSAASAAASSDDDAQQPVRGLVDDLTGSTLSPLTDALAPVIDPLDAAAAPVTRPVRDAVRPLTRSVGDVVGRVARPAAEQPAGTAPVAPTAPVALTGSSAAAERAVDAPTTTSTRPTAAASDAAAPAPTNDAAAGGSTAPDDDPRTADDGHLIQDAPCSALDTVAVGDLDFGPGSGLLAAWGIDDLGALTAAALVGPVPGAVHVGADDQLVAVLGTTDHTRTSQNSTRPDVSPG